MTRRDRCARSRYKYEDSPAENVGHASVDLIRVGENDVFIGWVNDEGEYIWYRGPGI